MGEPILASAANAASVVQAVTSVIQILNEANSERSCVLTIENRTKNTTLNILADGHESGGFAQPAVPAPDIGPQMVNVVGTANSGGSVGTGTEGWISYQGRIFSVAPDGNTTSVAAGLGLKIYWNNPFIDDPLSTSIPCKIEISGPNAWRYKALHTCGGGNQNEPMLYTLFDRPPANFADQNFVGNPVLIQSTYGEHGNYELLVPSEDGLCAYYRDNDSAGNPWGGSEKVSDKIYDAISMIQASHKNFEVIARHNDRLNWYFRDEYFNWNGPWPMHADGTEIVGVSGNPVLVQSTYGTIGNYELLVPLAAGGLAHFWRENDHPERPWHRGPIFGGSQRYEAISMIHSGYGNLEVVARSDCRLKFFFRDHRFNWIGPSAIIADGWEVDDACMGNPVLIQSTYGEHNNFELLVPRLDDSLTAYWRDNDTTGKAWHGPHQFGIGRPYHAITMIQAM